jgi:hypothetical protein
MGRATDLATLQFRMLNRGKGPLFGRHAHNVIVESDDARFAGSWRNTPPSSASRERSLVCSSTKPHQRCTASRLWRGVALRLARS